eukprot:12647486-Ditylum_brightwellii.AAC.1
MNHHFIKCHKSAKCYNKIDAHYSENSEKWEDFKEPNYLRLRLRLGFSLRHIFRHNTCSKGSILRAGA